MANKRNDTFKASDYYRALADVTLHLESMRECAEDELKSSTEQELRRIAEIREDYDSKEHDESWTIDEAIKNDWSLQNTLREIGEQSAKIFVIDKLLSSID